MHDHLVEFYETDELLVESVRNFFAPAIHSGDPVILVATPEHRAAFIAALQATGLDVAGARAHGLLVDLDAASTLSRFMVDGKPDAARFREVIGGLVRSTGRHNPRMRIYGEMVSLLWDEGNASGALELENLWNDLSSTYPFTLLCAYPLSSMEWGADNSGFRGICSTHSSARVRFSAPQAEAHSPGLTQEPEDGYSQFRGLGSELDALKNVIRNANRMGRLAENQKSVSQSGPSGLDYNLS